MLAIPIVMLIVTSALKSYDMNQELVARSLGANSLKAFPILAFLTSFDEVIVIMFVSGGENSTLTRNMSTALRDQIDPTIASISTIMTEVSSLLLAPSQLFGRSTKRLAHSGDRDGRFFEI